MYDRRQVTEDQFAALRVQEEMGYKCEDYLLPEYQNERLDYQSANAAMFDSLPSDPSAGSLNEVWREKICEWCYQVVDHFDFSREVVSVAMSYLDRYLSTRRVNKKIFQLAAMTCLYLAIKLYEPSSLKISSLIALSRGFFTAEHIIAMEESILRALNWRMHPPTVMSAARLYISLLSNEIDAQSRIDVIELSRFLSELSVCDYFFVTRKPSSVGLACILTAFEGVSHDRLPRKYRQKFVNDVYRIAKINCTVEEVHDCRLRLREIYERGNYHGKHDAPDAAHRGMRGQSPDNVSRHVEDDNMDTDNSASHNRFGQKNNGQMHSSYVNTVSAVDTEMS